MSAWRVLGTMTAAIAAFAGTFAVAFAITGGSIWMLAFFPVILGAAGAMIILGLKGLEL